MIEPWVVGLMSGGGYLLGFLVGMAVGKSFSTPPEAKAVEDEPATYLVRCCWCGRSNAARLGRKGKLRG